MSYASSGPGTPYHMAGELFKAMAGIDILHVPYKGSAGARTDVLGGQLDMMFDAIPTMAEHVKAGKVKALATTGKRALAILPDVPTHVRGRRAGLRDHDLARPDGAQGHAGGDRCQLNAEMAKITGNPEVRGGLGGAGHDADDDGRRRLHALHRRRHRQVGAHRQVLRRQGRLKPGGRV